MYNTGDYIIIQHGQSFIPAVVSDKKLSAELYKCYFCMYMIFVLNSQVAC